MSYFFFLHIGYRFLFKILIVLLLMDLIYFFFYIEYLKPLKKSSHKGQLSVNVYSLSINILIITFNVA